MNSKWGNENGAAERNVRRKCFCSARASWAFFGNATVIMGCQKREICIRKAVVCIYSCYLFPCWFVFLSAINNADPPPPRTADSMCPGHLSVCTTRFVLMPVVLFWPSCSAVVFLQVPFECQCSLLEGQHRNLLSPSGFSWTTSFLCGRFSHSALIPSAGCWHLLTNACALLPRGPSSALAPTAVRKDTLLMERGRVSKPLRGF